MFDNPPPSDSFPERLALTVQALQELMPELHAARTLGPLRPGLARILEGLGPLPRRALFLGMADDGLPVLLDLRDPAAGPLLLTADRGAGKTAFLHNIVRAASHLQTERDLQWGVLTAHPAQWEHLQGPQRVGVFAPYERAAGDLLLSMTAWAENARNTRQSLLLLIDGLEVVPHLEFEAQLSLRWLLAHGPSHRLWPIATVSPARRPQVLDWLEPFRTRLFGHMTDPAEWHALGGPSTGPDRLIPGAQFLLREHAGWIRFWIPAPEE